MRRPNSPSKKTGDYLAACRTADSLSRNYPSCFCSNVRRKRCCRPRVVNRGLPGSKPHYTFLPYRIVRSQPGRKRHKLYPSALPFSYYAATFI